MFISHKILNTKYVSTFFKRRSLKKIFIGKGELKHTSSKVIITFYVYNTEKISLKREYKKYYKSLYSPLNRSITIHNDEKVVTYLKSPLNRYITLDNDGNITKDLMGNEIISYNRPYTEEEFFNLSNKIQTSANKGQKLNIAATNQITYYDAYCSIVESFIDNWSSYFKVLNTYFEYLTELVKIKILNNQEKLLIFTSIAKNFYVYNYPSYDNYKEIADKSYKENLYRLRYLIKFNSAKFEKPFIAKLTDLVEKLYKKDVEFNIVNLKKMHLNSDILTQAIALKLKNKKNRVARVLRSSLNKVKLPNVNRLSEKSIESNNEYFINKIRNTNINDMFSNETLKTDSLNELLLNYFPSANKLEIDNLHNVKCPISLRNYVFRYLKHFRLAGVRLEAKGRLSRRFTASRSVFNLTWKGGLKNVDSSFKGLSTVMLRGDAKSNVEYSMIKSKGRIGAFGLKGWVSSK